MNWVIQQLCLTSKINIAAGYKGHSYSLNSRQWVSVFFYTLGCVIFFSFPGVSVAWVPKQQPTFSAYLGTVHCCLHITVQSCLLRPGACGHYVYSSINQKSFLVLQQLKSTADTSKRKNFIFVLEQTHEDEVKQLTSLKVYTLKVSMSSV